MYVIYLVVSFKFTGTPANRERVRENKTIETCRTSKYFKSIIVISVWVCFFVPFFSLFVIFRLCSKCSASIPSFSQWCYLVGSLFIHLVYVCAVALWWRLLVTWLYRWVFFYWGNFLYFRMICDFLLNETHLLLFIELLGYFPLKMTYLERWFSWNYILMFWSTLHRMVYRANAINLSYEVTGPYFL